MSRYTPRNSTEFETRQMCFEFGARARRIATQVGKTIKTMKKWLCREFRKAIQVKKPHQYVLELDAIAQIPLFGNLH
jgi:hypothetical protein